MGRILERAEECWAGRIEPREFWKPTGEREEIASGVFFVHASANVTVVPSHLKPVSEAEIGRELVALVGGIDALVARARALAAAGRLALASHLIDWAVAAEAGHAAAHAARAGIYERRAAEARALMTRGIFSATARESAERARPPATGG